MDHHHPAANGVGYGLASLTLTATAQVRAAGFGIDAPTVAFLIGAVGSLILALVQAAREVRAWKDRGKAP